MDEPATASGDDVVATGFGSTTPVKRAGAVVGVDPNTAGLAVVVLVGVGRTGATSDRVELSTGGYRCILELIVEILT